MEKLIELLNKHRVELVHGNIQNQIMWHYNGYVFGLGDLNSQNCVLLIISKDYGFIQRLVDNDKIDLLRLDNRIALSEFNKVERVLMFLAIQDYPIENLISVLK